MIQVHVNFGMNFQFYLHRNFSINEYNFVANRNFDFYQMNEIESCSDTQRHTPYKYDEQGHACMYCTIN